MGPSLRAQTSAQATCTNAVRISARRSQRTARRRLANNQTSGRAIFQWWRPSRWLDSTHGGRSAA